MVDIHYFIFILNADTALVAVHHMRKAGGQDGDGILGSTAIFGMVKAKRSVSLEKMEAAIRKRFNR